MNTPRTPLEWSNLIVDCMNVETEHASECDGLPSRHIEEAMRAAADAALERAADRLRALHGKHGGFNTQVASCITEVLALKSTAPPPGEAKVPHSCGADEDGIHREARREREPAPAPEKAAETPFSCGGDHGDHTRICRADQPHGDYMPEWHLCCLPPGHDGAHRHHNGTTWSGPAPRPAAPAAESWAKGMIERDPRMPDRRPAAPAAEPDLKPVKSPAPAQAPETAGERCPHGYAYGGGLCPTCHPSATAALAAAEKRAKDADALLREADALIAAASWPCNEALLKRRDKWLASRRSGSGGA